MYSSQQVRSPPSPASQSLMYRPQHRYWQQPEQVKTFAQTQREADEQFYATFPDARRAVEAQWHSTSSTYFPGTDYYYATQLSAPADLGYGDSGYIALGGEASGQGQQFQFQPAYPEDIAHNLNYDYPPRTEVTHPVSIANTSPQRPFLQQQQQSPHHQHHYQTYSVRFARHLMMPWC